MNNLKFVPDIVTGRLTEADAKRYFSRFGWFAFAYFVINTVVQNVIAIAVLYLFPSVYRHFLFWELLSVIPSYCISLPLAYQIIRPLPSVDPIKGKMKPTQLISGLCISVTLMWAGNYVSNIILTAVTAAMGGVSENPVVTMVEGMPTWATVLFVVIVAPILEEIMFRAIICKKLLILGEGYAVILPAAFFALCHGNFYQLFYAFALGCFFSFIYVKTGRLIYSVIYHMAINLFGSVIAPFIIKMVDYEALLDGTLKISRDTLFGVALLLAYEIFVMGASIAGIVLIVKNISKFKPESGLLPPPEGKTAGCVLLNSGIAAAIAVFSLTLVYSLFT